MVFTYIHLIGIVITIAYIATFIYASRLEQHAYETADRKDQFIILEANASKYGFWACIMIFFTVVVVAYFVNTFSFARFQLDPIAIIGVIAVGISAEIRNRLSDEHQRSKEVNAQVPLSYKRVEKKAATSVYVASVVLFAYLIFAF